MATKQKIKKIIYNTFSWIENALVSWAKAISDGENNLIKLSPMVYISMPTHKFGDFVIIFAVIEVNKEFIVPWDAWKGVEIIMESDILEFNHSVICKNNDIITISTTKNNLYKFSYKQIIGNANFYVTKKALKMAVDKTKSNNYQSK